MGYLIVAYGLVIATLVVYGLRVQAQRRALLRRARGRTGPGGD